MTKIKKEAVWHKKGWMMRTLTQRMKMKNIFQATMKIKWETT
jgi:hypothetical protein